MLKNLIYWFALIILTSCQPNSELKQEVDSKRVIPLTTESENLLEAIKKKNIDQIEEIIRYGFDLNQSISDFSFLRQVLFYSDLSTLKLLLESGLNPNNQSADQMTPTHFASGLEFEKFKLLVDFGGDFNTHCTNCISSTPFAFALTNDRIDNVKFMIKNDYKTEPSESNGYTSALIESIVAEHYELSKQLVQKGANLSVSTTSLGDFCSVREMSILHLLASKYENHIDQEMINELIKNMITNGVEVNAVNPVHQSALDFAACSGNKDFIKLMLSYGAELGNSVYYAALSSNWELIDFLCKKGANPNVMVGTQTPLMISISCCGDGFGESIKLEDRIRTAEILLKYGADPLQEGFVQTCYWARVKSGQHQLYEHFIQKGSLKWEELEIDFHGQFSDKYTVKSEPTHLYLQPNLKSPIIDTLQMDTEILIKNSQQVLLDQTSGKEFLWKQVMYKDKRGFIKE